MPLDIPHKALVVVADGVGAHFFRNGGDAGTLRLTSEGDLKPVHLGTDGPSGHRPKEERHQETDEATLPSNWRTNSIAAPMLATSRRWF